MKELSGKSNERKKTSSQDLNSDRDKGNVSEKPFASN